MTLNDRALHLTDRLVADAETLRIAVSQSSDGAGILDCGVRADGGLAAGLAWRGFASLTWPRQRCCRRVLAICPVR